MLAATDLKPDARAMLIEFNNAGENGISYGKSKPIPNVVYRLYKAGWIQLIPDPNAHVKNAYLKITYKITEAGLLIASQLLQEPEKEITMPNEDKIQPVAETDCKVCKVCGVSKPKEAFSKTNRGERNTCRRCVAARISATRNKREEVINTIIENTHPASVSTVHEELALCYELVPELKEIVPVVLRLRRRS